MVTAREELRKCQLRWWLLRGEGSKPGRFLPAPAMAQRWDIEWSNPTDQALPHHTRRGISTGSPDCFQLEDLQVTTNLKNFYLVQSWGIQISHEQAPFSYWQAALSFWEMGWNALENSEVRGTWSLLSSHQVFGFSSSPRARKIKRRLWKPSTRRVQHGLQDANPGNSSVILWSLSGVTGVFLP